MRPGTKTPTLIHTHIHIVPTSIIQNGNTPFFFFSPFLSWACLPFLFSKGGVRFHKTLLHIPLLSSLSCSSLLSTHFPSRSALTLGAGKATTKQEHYLQSSIREELGERAGCDFSTFTYLLYISLYDFLMFLSNFFS
ncbi:hypothetical protein GE21DRAFT_1108718 [Neurospora crassa]|nr:hypothetical protein GE21DRAFT_1108718 [Neurospora crassa]